MANNGWFDRSPLGQLASTTGEVNYLNEPKIEHKNTLSQEKNKLLEDFRSGLMDASELQAALKALK